jgi:hypothetical protein
VRNPIAAHFILTEAKEEIKRRPINWIYQEMKNEGRG